jgi:hypothetical protein
MALSDSRLRDHHNGINKQTGEELFDSAAPSVGGGLRLLFNKRSRTHLCLDFAWGKDGSSGVYIAIQDAF